MVFCQGSKYVSILSCYMYLWCILANLRDNQSSLDGGRVETWNCWLLDWVCICVSDVWLVLFLLFSSIFKYSYWIGCVFAFEMFGLFLYHQIVNSTILVHFWLLNSVLCAYNSFSWIPCHWCEEDGRAWPWWALLPPCQAHVQLAQDEAPEAEGVSFRAGSSWDWHRSPNLCGCFPAEEDRLRISSLKCYIMNLLSIALREVKVGTSLYIGYCLLLYFALAWSCKLLFMAFDVGILLFSVNNIMAWTFLAVEKPGSVITVVLTHLFLFFVVIEIDSWNSCLLLVYLASQVFFCWCGYYTWKRNLSSWIC